MKMWAKTQKGFTIVELLIVIVIIGVLAAITIVAYNGIQTRANNTSVQSDMRNFGQKLEEYVILNGRPPANATELQTINFKFNTLAYDSRVIIYCKDDLGNFGITGRSASGAGFLYSHEKGRVFSGTVGGSWTTTCPQAGVSTAAGDGSYGQWGNNSASWYPW